MDWARILAFVTGMVDKELLARIEYLAAENRILKAQLKGRLSKVILFCERSLRRALSEYVEHFHAKRNHQGKGNILLFPRSANSLFRYPLTDRPQFDILQFGSQGTECNSIN